MTAVDPRLPGAELVEPGLAAMRRGEQTDEALLVSMAATRLRSIGLDVPAPFADPELRLYASLRARYGDDAHARYNALVRRLVRFEQAVECVR